MNFPSTSNHSGHFSTALRSIHEIMMDPWKKNEKIIDRNLIFQSRDAIVARLKKEDSTSLWLIEQLTLIGADIALTEKNENLAMIITQYIGEAFWVENKDVIEKLFAEHPSYLLTDNNGSTALMMAVHAGKLEMANSLLKSGSNPLHCNIDDISVLDAAKGCSRCFDMVDMIATWMEEKKMISIKAREELQLLFYETLISGNIDVAKRLSVYGSENKIEEITKAIHEGREDSLIITLLDFGGDFNHKDENGDGWIDLARKERRGKLMGVLSMYLHKHRY